MCAPHAALHVVEVKPPEMYIAVKHRGVQKKTEKKKRQVEEHAIYIAHNANELILFD